MNKEELLRELETVVTIRSFADESFKKLRKVALEIGKGDLLKRFVNYDTLDNLADEKYGIGGLRAVKEFLHGVDNFSCDVFCVDYYGNARNVLGDDLYYLKYRLKKEIEEL